MLIDTHVHVWPLDDAPGHRPVAGAKVRQPEAAAPVEWLLEDMAETQMDHCVLVQSSAFGWDNTYMVECLEAYPGRFKAIGLVDPLSVDNGGDLRRWVRRGLIGTRLHPLYYPDEPTWIDSSQHDALWRTAADLGAILQFHLLPEHAPALDRMARRHPATRVIVDHIGKPDVTEAPPWRAFGDVLRLAECPNIWLKIGDIQIASRMAYPWPDTYPFLTALKAAFGPDRMIWGTGYPRTARLVPLAEALTWVRTIPGFTRDDLEQILGETPRRLFGF
jgi:predicted TIM-barrel fold metal-dependent hydrolase